MAAALLAFAGCCDEDNCINEVHYHNAPPVPTGVYTVTGNGAVQIYWNAVRGVGDVEYGVWRCDVADGTYQRIATVIGSESTYYYDQGLENGRTYYYAVDAFNEWGESDLSWEMIADTPRPEGENLLLYYEAWEPGMSGIDFSRYVEGMVVSWEAEKVDCYLIVVDGIFRLVPTIVEEEGEFFANDIQDFGYTDHMDEISFAPVEGWSSDEWGVEMIVGHVYIVWTWDDHFAKLRVVSVGENSVVLDWAYQFSADELERRQLAPRFAALTKSGN